MDLQLFYNKIMLARKIKNLNLRIIALNEEIKKNIR